MLSSEADRTAMRSNPGGRPHMEAAAAFATSDPIVCEVVDSISADE